jgi:hypothetical protein
MVMIESTDAPFREYANERPGNQRRDVIDERVHQHIAAEQQGKEENRKSVLRISKDAHEYLADKGFNQKESTARTSARTRR